MLSENVKALADRLRRYQDSGVQADAPAVAAIVAILDQCAEDARALERQVVPAGARIQADELPEGVVALARKLHRQGVRVGAQAPNPTDLAAKPPGAAPDGGDAA